MRHPRKLRQRPLRLTVPFVLLLLVLALALPALALADEPKYVVQNATTSCFNADVSGDLAVWEDAAGNEDIWGRVLPGGVAFPIVQLSSTQQVTPAADGTTVVWADDRASAGVYKIYGASVNLATNGVSEFPISTTAGVKSDPDVSGRYVVWTNYVSASNTYDIYGYDLLTATEFPICTNTAKQDQPAISGDLVVWRDYRNNATYPDIYAARISTPSHAISEFAVCAQPSLPVHLDSQPAVGGTTVAWLDQRGGGNARIYAATVIGTTVSGEWQVSTTATRSVSSPAVNGTLIAWTYSGGTSNDDVYACRPGGSEFPIVSTSAFESGAAVTAGRTVWTNKTTWDIYGADIGGLGWTAGITIDGGAGWATTRNVDLMLSGTSSVGAATQMCFSNNAADWSGWETFTTSRSYQLPSGDGTKTVYVMFKDAEGNVSPVRSDGILLDEHAPVASDDAPAGWSTGDVTVTLTADDGAGSGVQAIVFELDGRGVDTYIGPITVSGDGVHTLVYCAVDNLGQVGQWKSVDVYIDATAPATSDNTGGGWHASGFVLALDAYDAVGVDHTEYSLDGGTTWATGATRSFVTSGKRAGSVTELTVLYRSVDSAGNVESAKSCQVKIDRRPPVTANDYDGLPHATDLTVNLTGEDPHSGVRETWYSLDGGEWVQGASVIVPAPGDGSNDGPHTIVYYSIDNIGNAEMVRSVTVLIDAAP